MPVDEAEEWRKTLELYEIEKKSLYEQAKFNFEQSKTYNTVIVGLAYGGFFAIWSPTNVASPDKKTLALAGALMTISLISFVTFTLINMVTLSKINVGFAKIALSYGVPADRESFNVLVASMMDTRRRVSAELNNLSVWLMRLWPPFFYTAVLAGLGGTLLLLFLQLKIHGLWLLNAPVK